MFIKRLIFHLAETPNPPSHRICTSRPGWISPSTTLQERGATNSVQVSAHLNAPGAILVLSLPFRRALSPLAAKKPHRRKLIAPAMPTRADRMKFRFDPERVGSTIVKHDGFLLPCRSNQDPGRDRSTKQEALAVCEDGLRRMQAARAPGLTGDCRICTRRISKLGGEWIETRLLNSGPRTNPWYQEASARVIENGHMIAFNSDLIGPHGYSCTSISRELARRGPPRARRPSAGLYAAAACAGAGEYRAFPARHDAPRDPRGGHPCCPSDLAERQEGCIAHGIGLCKEYPLVLHLRHFAPDGHDGWYRRTWCSAWRAMPPWRRMAAKG